MTPPLLLLMGKGYVEEVQDAGGLLNDVLPRA